LHTIHNIQTPLHPPLARLAALEVKYTDVTPLGVQQFQAARLNCAVFN
jgi:hypothetical protein